MVRNTKKNHLGPRVGSAVTNKKINPPNPIIKRIRLVSKILLNFGRFFSVPISSLYRNDVSAPEEYATEYAHRWRLKPV